jgi:hypothetical protein
MWKPIHLVSPNTRIDSCAFTGSRSLAVIMTLASGWCCQGANFGIDCRRHP